MPSALPKTFDRVLRVLSSTIHALKRIHTHDGKPASDARLGVVLGLSRDQVVKIKNFATLPSLRAAWLIAQEASRYDVDLVAGQFAFGRKRIMLPPEALPAPNRSTAEENQALLVCGGAVNDRLWAGDFAGARRFADGIIRAGWAFHDEISAIERGGFAVLPALPCRRQAGDALPNHLLTISP